MQNEPRGAVYMLPLLIENYFLIVKEWSTTLEVGSTNVRLIKPALELSTQFSSYDEGITGSFSIFFNIFY